MCITSCLAWMLHAPALRVTICMFHDLREFMLYIYSSVCFMTSVDSSGCLMLYVCFLLYALSIFTSMLHDLSIHCMLHNSSVFICMLHALSAHCMLHASRYSFVCLMTHVYSFVFLMFRVYSSCSMHNMCA